MTGLLRDEGLAILLVEQNLPSALAVADRVCVLETGRVVYEATAAEVERDDRALTGLLGVQ